MKNKLIYLAGIILIVAVIYGGVYAFKAVLIPAKVVTTQIDSSYGIVDKIYSPDNAIYNYEWFKTQYEKIKMTEKQIENTEDQINDFRSMYGNSSTWDWTTKEEYNRLSVTLTGLKNHYEELVALYNARSKMANRNIFKNKLPFHIDKKIW